MAAAAADSRGLGRSCSEPAFSGAWEPQRIAGCSLVYPPALPRPPSSNDIQDPSLIARPVASAPGRVCKSAQTENEPSREAPEPALSRGAASEAAPQEEPSESREKRTQIEADTDEEKAALPNADLAPRSLLASLPTAGRRRLPAAPNAVLKRVQEEAESEEERELLEDRIEDLAPCSPPWTVGSHPPPNSPVPPSPPTPSAVPAPFRLGQREAAASVYRSGSASAPVPAKQAGCCMSGSASVPVPPLRRLRADPSRRPRSASPPLRPPLTARARLRRMREENAAALTQVLSERRTLQGLRQPQVPVQPVPPKGFEDALMCVQCSTRARDCQRWRQHLSSWQPVGNGSWPPPELLRPLKNERAGTRRPLAGVGSEPRLGAAPKDGSCSARGVPTSTERPGMTARLLEENGMRTHCASRSNSGALIAKSSTVCGHLHSRGCDARTPTPRFR